MSDDLQDVTGPIVKFDDEQGIELYYNYAVTPWFMVTPDIQWIDPANGEIAKTWVAGLRANLTF
ncbi:MAG: carbohydrate porin [Halioglobus sp.]